MKFFKWLLLPLIAVLLGGCWADSPSPEDEDDRPTLHYRPKYKHLRKIKYPVKLGVMTYRDTRALPFYDEDDHYFQEDIAKAVSNVIYSEIKGSGMFKEVVRIKEECPKNLTKKELTRIRNAYKVDMILCGDVQKFNMFREKTGANQINTFKVIIDVSYISQLIYLKKGIVIWADKVERRKKELAKDGALDTKQLGELVTETLKQTTADMNALILAGGKVMKRRKK